MIKKIVTATMILVASWGGTTPVKADVLDRVKLADALDCGIAGNIPGFSVSDENGSWTGINVDFCRAVAAAVLGDSNKVTFREVEREQGKKLLENGTVDLLFGHKIWSAKHVAMKGLNFTGITYFDGQGFLVRKSQSVKSVLELSRAPVCVKANTSTAINVENYFRRNSIEYEIVLIDDDQKLLSAYDAGRCKAYAGAQLDLYSQRLKLPQPEEHIVLPEVISKEPHGPAVAQGDDQWFRLVQWVHFMMLNAEEHGITSSNVDDMKNSENAAVKLMLSEESSLGTSLGVGKDWAYNIIKMVGNYGEVFNRNLGPETPLGISRGLNALWSNGGLQYAPPVN